jgi:ELWxxDGT repeat protein
MVADLNQGFGTSSPTNFASLNNNLLFTAYSPILGDCLFKSDGTNQGTVVVRNQWTLYDYINWYDFQNSKLFQSSNDKSNKIWITDGTTNGTYPIFNLSNFSPNSTIRSGLLISSGYIYLITEEVDAVWGNIIHRLCRIDYNFQNFEILHVWQNNFQPNYCWFQLEKLGEFIFIGDFGSTSVGTWSYNLTTNLVTQITNNGTFFTADSKVNYNNKIFFSKNGNLYSIDGTNTQISTVLSGFSVGQLIVFNNLIHFTGGNIGPGLQGVELYKTDGTAANTTIVKDVYFGFNSSYPRNYKILNDKLFFEANSLNGNGVFCFNNSTNLLTETYSMNIDNISSIVFNNRLYFYAPYNSYDIWKLWETNGNIAVLTTNIDSTSDKAMIRDFNIAENVLFFIARDNQHDQELWSSVSNNSLGFGNIENLDFAISPNPTKDIISIKGETNMNQPFSIFDQMGREVFKGKLTGSETEVNLSALSKGIYILKIEGNYPPAKIVKE